MICSILVKWTPVSSFTIAHTRNLHGNTQILTTPYINSTLQNSGHLLVYKLKSSFIYTQWIQLPSLPACREVTPMDSSSAPEPLPGAAVPGRGSTPASLECQPRHQSHTHTQHPNQAYFCFVFTPASAGRRMKADTESAPLIPFAHPTAGWRRASVVLPHVNIYFIYYL